MKERIKARRKELKLSQEGLAKRIGLTKGSISQWEQGATTPNGENLYRLAEALRVSATWLIKGEEGKASGNVSSHPSKQRSIGPDEIEFHDTEIVEEDAPIGPDEVEIPYFREVEMAAGSGCTQVVENHGHTMRFPLARLSRAGVQPENAACATIRGNSMEDRILDGSPIGIDKGTRYINDGDIYALDHDGMLRVKYLYRLPLNRVRVVSENSDEHPEEVYSLDSPDAPKIIGRVFWWETFA